MLRAAAIVLLISALASIVAAQCLNACSSRGVCTPDAYCVCPVGWLGADCSVGNATALWFETSSGAKLFEFVTTPDAYVHVRISFQRAGYFGMIFDPQPDGMTNGDCWGVSVDARQNVIVQDRWSKRQKTPTYDQQQDLESPAGYLNTTNQVVYFKRALRNTDKWDQQFCTTPGCFVRMVFTEGRKSLSSSGEMGMHRLAGYCGQLIIDWVGGTARDSTLGVRWPRVYWFWAAAFSACVLIAAVTQRRAVKASALGRWMRTPLRLLCVSSTSSSSTAPVADEQSCSIADAITFNFASASASLSVNEFLLVLLYAGVCMAVSIVASIADYTAIGRPPTYLAGHLAALHFAAAVLPITRHSLWLPLFNIDYEVAIRWHRRVARAGIVIALLHGADMLALNFEFDDILSTASVTSAGGACLFGALAVVCFLVILVTSHELVRRSCFEAFYHVHLVLAPLGLFFACLHSVNLRYLLITPTALWLLDFALRCAHAHALNPARGRAVVHRATVYADMIPAANAAKRTALTHLELEWPGDADEEGEDDEARDERAREFAGGYFWVNAPDVSAVQWHPFSISSAFPPPAKSRTAAAARAPSSLLEPLAAADNDDATERTFSLHIQASPDADQWTNALAAHVRRLATAAPSWSSSSSSSKSTSSTVSIVAAPGTTHPLQLRVYGPFRNRDVDACDTRRFRTVVLVAGGVGVTPCTSVLDTLLQRYERTLKRNGRRQRGDGGSADGYVRVEQDADGGDDEPLQVHLVWASMSVHALTTWFAPLFERVDAANASAAVASHAASAPFQLHLYHTRASAHAAAQLAAQQHGRAVLAGRPNIDALVQRFLEPRASGDGDGRAVKLAARCAASTLVFTCGPRALMDAAEEAAARCGAHFHREGFAT